MVERVIATDRALALIDRLRQKHGPLMFHQPEASGEGSAPDCFPQGRFMAGAADLLLGEIGGCPIYISKSRYDYWQYAQLILDVAESRAGGAFAPEDAEGVGFHTRTRRFSTEEWAVLSSNPLHQERSGTP